MKDKFPISNFKFLKKIQYFAPVFFLSVALLLSHGLFLRNEVIAQTGQNYTLGFSTYLGGNGFDSARDVAIDSAGNVYVTGGTSSTNFPKTIGPAFNNGTCASSGSSGKMDVFITKYSPTGQRLWSRLLGGPCYDRAYGIEVDAQQNVYVGGRAGENFPTCGSPGVTCVSTAGVVQPNFAGDSTPNGAYGDQDGFVTKISPDGSQIIWSTYFGTSTWDFLRDITIDSSGNVYLAVSALRNAFSASNVVNAVNQTGFKKTYSGAEDGMIVKLSPNANSILYASYYGGSGTDAVGPSVRVDSNGYIYTVGGTNSTNALSGCTGTRPAPAQSSFAGGINDQFLIKIDPSPSKNGCASLMYQTYFGGSGNEGSETHTLAVDGAQNAYITGGTDSPNFSNVTGFNSSPGFKKTNNCPTCTGSARYDSFVAKIDTTSGQVVAGTFIGGTAEDSTQGLSVDSSGNLYIGGDTSSTNLPVTTNAYQKALSGGPDSFVAKMPPDLSRFDYASYLGGSTIDVQRSFWGNASGAMVSVGETNSTNFPKVNAAQSSLGGGNGDAYVTKFSLQAGEATLTPVPSVTSQPTKYPTNSPVPTTQMPTNTPVPTSVPIGDGEVDGTPPVTTNDILVLFPKWNSLGALPLDQYGDGVINTLDFSVVANKLVSPTSAPTSGPTVAPTTSGGGSAGVPKCMRYPILASTLPSSSWGSGYAQVDTVNNTITYKFQFKNLSSAATAAHIHGYAPRSTTTLAPTLHTITIPAATSGSVSGSWTYPEADEANILKGLAYINIHTAQQPAGEVAYWLDGGVPCVPIGQTTLPLCSSHDPKAYHALIDPVNNCHYKHEHKENPHNIDDVLGAPGKWWQDMYALIGQNVPAQENSYPWLTANGLENMMYKDASGNIIGGKHESYGNIVRKDMPASASRGGGFLKHFRMHTHMDLHAQGNLTRYHSYGVEGVICTKANPSDCGTFRFGGHGDYEELNVKVGNTLVHVPLATDPKVTPRPGQTLAQALRESLARHDHASQVTGQDGLVFNDWYATRKNDLVETALKDTPFNYVTYNIFTNDGFTTTDPANPAIDPANPATLHLTCPDFKCPRNNSTVSLARMLVTMRSPNPYVGSNGKINYRGFTDRYGNELPGACKTKGCVPTTKCTAGPDCVPMEAIDLPDLGAGGPDFSDRTSNIEVRDFDTSPAATGIGSEWWIEFPN